MNSFFRPILPMPVFLQIQSTKRESFEINIQFVAEKIFFPKNPLFSKKLPFK